jgi:lipid A 3-O-deacylase
MGGTLNTVGKTSLAYAGAAWTWDFGGSPWFVEPQLGAAWHNGEASAAGGSRRLSLGCSPLFHTGASGGYRLNRRWAVMATWEHASNADLCHHNEGLNNAGVRMSYSF